MKSKKISVTSTKKSNLTAKELAKQAGVKSNGKILLLHGPNLNMLGQREPNHYGSITLETINKQLANRANELDIELISFQSNHEGILIDRIQQARLEDIDFIIINPAGYTHTSVAMRDALSGVAIPFIEVHLSNIYSRETFRHHSYFSDIAIGVISGLGAGGYFAALEYCYQQLIEAD